MKVMQYREYGNENADVLLLIHGGGLSWWNYRAAAYAKTVREITGH